MNPIFFDTEATTYAKGNPFSSQNRLCALGLRTSSRSVVLPFEYDSGAIYGGQSQETSRIMREANPLVAFNFKFDCHWITRYGISLPSNIRIWDCQLAHFIIQGQRSPYPSLDGICSEYGVVGKSGSLVQYWDAGIDTPDIPWNVIEEYNKGDLAATEACFNYQMEFLKDRPKLLRLIWLACQDLLNTAEMEWNGLQYNFELSLEKGQKIKAKLENLDGSLSGFVGDLPLNWNSGDHISAYLYGGVAKYKARESYTFEYKDGRIKEREHWVIKEHLFPRLVQPIKNTELKKGGYYQTDLDTLRSLDARGEAKEVIEMLLQRSVFETSINRYYFGFPDQYREMDWSGGRIHTTFNHCVAATGRLSSMKPNIQNLDDGIKECIQTRF